MLHNVQLCEKMFELECIHEFQIVGLVQLTILFKPLCRPSAKLEYLGQSAQLAVVDRRWASVDKAASAAIFLEDAAPVGLISTLLVASVAESSKYCFWASL